VIASASGSGKTTVGRELASRLGVPFLELDALVHGPNWTTTPDDEIRRTLEPTLTRDAWVIDGSCSRAYGDSVLAASDTIVWLDLPVRVWFPRLARRNYRRWRTQEELWNGNCQLLRNMLWGREWLFAWAFRQHFRRRREYPARLTPYDVRRLRTPVDVERFLASVATPTGSTQREAGTSG